MSTDRAARPGGLVIVAGSAVAGLVVAGPGDLYAHGSLYPWWTWVLVLAGVLGGSLLLLVPRPSVLALAPAVALVASAQLAGTGLVARRHWLPAQGMGGVGNVPLERVEVLALLMAVGAGAATVGAAVVLVRSSALAPRLWSSTSWAPLLASAVVVLTLPVALAREAGGPTLTTWGAGGLIYAGPWALGLAAAAWARRDTALVVVVAVVGSSALAAVGPQMPDLFTTADDRVLLVPAVLAAAAAAVMVLRGPTPASA